LKNLRKVFLMLLIAVVAAGLIPRGAAASEAENEDRAVFPGAEEELEEDEAVSYEVPATGRHGFRLIQGKRYYYKKDGSLATGWTRIYNNLYFMGKNGVVRTGWRSINGEDCYFNFRGRLVFRGKKTDAKAQQLQFIETIADGIRKHGEKYHICCYSGVIGQAILESGWGRSTLASKYNNYFGLKCGSSWKGRSVNLKTMEEYSAGKTSVIYDYFRVYKTPAAGIKGFFEFIDTPRYANLKNVKDPERYVELVKKDGYATSSSYVSVLNSIIRYNNLKAYDPY